MSNADRTSDTVHEKPADPLEGLTGVPRALFEAILADPGASAGTLAPAAGTSRATAGKVLAVMEAEGLVRREPGGHVGGRRTSDRWYVTTHDIGAADTQETETTAPEPESVDTACEVPTEPETAGDAETPGGPSPIDPPSASQSGPDENGDERDDTDSPSTQPDEPAPLDVTAPEASMPDGPSDGAGAEGTPAADQVTGVPPSDGDGGERIPEDGTRGPAAETASAEVSAAGADGSAVPEPLTADDAPAQPAPATAVAPGEPCPTCGHRQRMSGVQVPAASGGSRLGQGQLHQLALDHLRAHPDQEWTATGIAKEIGRSSGAIANALATMTGRGEAEMTCAAPRRYRAMPSPQAATESPAGS